MGKWEGDFFLPVHSSVVGRPLAPGPPAPGTWTAADERGKIPLHPVAEKGALIGKKKPRPSAGFKNLMIIISDTEKMSSP